MDGKIGIIAEDIEFKRYLTSLFSDDVKNGKFIIDIYNPDNIDEQAKMLEKKGAEVIIARSSIYRNIINKVNIPTVHLNITTIDILNAIKTASKFNKKKIILVISALDYVDFYSWIDMIGVNLLVERPKTRDDIENIVSKYVPDQSDVVIIGGVVVCNIAEKYNLNKVYLRASKESIYEAVITAKELVSNLYEQKYKNEILKTTLDGVHDAVIAINTEGKVILYNKRAEELLNKAYEEVIGKDLLDIFPELSFMMDISKYKENKCNEIVDIKKIIIAANISMLKVDGNNVGVLCSFQDITKLQNLEKKIRYELNKKGLVAKYKFEDIIAYDPVMKNILEKAKIIGLYDSTVMIYGESGTGKEMIAQAIHNISSRKNAPFVAINCAAISESLLESELFGYEEGAFTGARKGGKPGLFELAHDGTLFLDEIDSVSLKLQAKLLRVLEEKEVMRIGSDYIIPLNVRIISAANETLKRKVEEGSFRSDLFYRLSILELYVPPLRERKKDIIPLFKYFVSKHSEMTQQLSFDEKLEEKLISYSWPGNVRELRNIAQRYTIFGEINFDEIEASRKVNELPMSNVQQKNEIMLDLKLINKFVEKKVIDLLASQGMSKNEIAKLLGISRSSLWNKLNNTPF